MKRLVTCLVIVLAATLVSAIPAEAGHRKLNCASHTWTNYFGIQSTANLRYGRMEVTMHACFNRRTGLVVHRKTSTSMNLYPNSISDFGGYEWFHGSAFRTGCGGDTGDNYCDKRVYHAWWRTCVGVGDARVCSPTGDFTVVVTFKAKRLVTYEGSQRWTEYRRAGEPFKSPGSYDKQIRFYNTA